MKNIILGALLTVIGLGIYHSVFIHDTRLIFALSISAVFVIRDIYTTNSPSPVESKQSCEDCQELVELKKQYLALEQKFKRLKYFGKK